MSNVVDDNGAAGRQLNRALVNGTDGVFELHQERAVTA